MHLDPSVPLTDVAPLGLPTAKILLQATAQDREVFGGDGRRCRRNRSRLLAVGVGT